MRARLFCPVGELRLDHTFDTEVTIGRGPTNSLVLSHEVLSGHHLRVHWNGDDGAYRLEDLHSSNGTRLDGARVSTPRSLGHLHVITLADRFHFVFQDLERCAERHGVAAHPGARPLEADKTSIQPLPLPLPDVLRQPPPAVDDSQAISDKTLFDRLPIPIPSFLRKKEPTTAAHSKGTADALPVGPSSPFAPPPTPRVSEVELLLEVRVEDGSTLALPLAEGEHLLGRGLEASLQVLSPQVSRSHARLTVRGDEVLLRDLGSSNHTFVDGLRLDDETVITPGQTLAFGLLKAKLVRRTRTPNTAPNTAPNAGPNTAPNTTGRETAR